MPEYSSTPITPADGVKTPAMNGSTSGNYTLADLRAFVLASKGLANGLASLDANGKLPTSQLPDLADDVLVYGSYALLPSPGTAGKLYITADDNKMYRWDDALATPDYVVLSVDLSDYATEAELTDVKNALTAVAFKVQTDSTSAYVKTVPKGADYAKVVSFDSGITKIVSQSHNLYPLTQLPSYSYQWSQSYGYSTYASRAVFLKANTVYYLNFKEKTRKTIDIRLWDATDKSLKTSGLSNTLGYVYNYNSGIHCFVPTSNRDSQYLTLKVDADSYADFVTAQDSETTTITECALYEGFLYPYSPYFREEYEPTIGQEIKVDSLGTLTFENANSEALDSTIDYYFSDELDARLSLLDDYKAGMFIEKGSLSDGESFQLPINNISKNKMYAFSADITTFNELLIGHGTGNTFANAYITIDSTNLVFHYYTSSWQTATYAHGLTIDKYIHVLLTTNERGLPKVTIRSNDSSYSSSDSIYGWQGTTNTGDLVRSNGCELTNCVFSSSCKDLRTDLYVFGDSYLGLTDSKRWAYYLVGEYDNMLINAFPGEPSASAITALKNLLTIGHPKAILWCMGMNDNADSSTLISPYWTKRIVEFLAICEEQHIEPILATIPSVPNQSNEQKNAWVRNSGYRYVDFAKAVGAQADGTWYSGMLDSDNVHPTANGAVALYYEAITACPELTF